jgi:hypothetical protein
MRAFVLGFERAKVGKPDGILTAKIQWISGRNQLVM